MNVQVRKNYIRAIRWALTVIQGINPMYCMNKIRLEEGKEGSIKHQRRLNPIMKEVIK